MGKGDKFPEDVPGVERQRLLHMRRELKSLLAQIESELKELKGSQGRSGRPDLDRTAAAVRRPVRQVVLDALEDIGWPTYSRELSLYCQARTGRAIPAARFGSLANDEVRAYSSRSRPRPVWLCFGLTYDRGEPIKRLWARSDWQLEKRIVAPTTGRIQHLKLTQRLCELAEAADETAFDPEMMRIISADHARDLNGVRVKRGEFNLREWRDQAEELLAELEPQDTALRRKAARQFGRLPDVYQLFGLPDVLEGGRALHQAGGDRS